MGGTGLGPESTELGGLIHLEGIGPGEGATVQGCRNKKGQRLDAPPLSLPFSLLYPPCHLLPTCHPETHDPTLADAAHPRQIHELQFIPCCFSSIFLAQAVSTAMAFSTGPLESHDAAWGTLS